MIITEKRIYPNKTLFLLNNGKEITESSAITLIKKKQITNAGVVNRGGKEYVRGKVNSNIRIVNIPHKYKNVEAIKPLITTVPNTMLKANKYPSFQRDLYKDLLNWKETTDLALFLKGPRQVGKTYLLKKFGKEQFKQVVYIDLTREMGNKFLEAYYGFSKNNQFGSSDKDKLLFWLNVFTYYNPSFNNSEDTLIIIDEIQENSDIYNSIRDIRRTLRARLAVTGSYLAFAQQSHKYEVATGDYIELHLNTLSYIEYLKAVKVYDDYIKLNSFSLSNLTENEKRVYNKIESLYNDYLQIGGYPAVVQLYIESKGDIEICKRQVRMLLSQFYTESRKYFKDIVSDSMFTNTMILMLQDLISKSGNLNAKDIPNKEKYYQDLSIKRPEKNNILRWLIDCHILGECALYTDWSLRETSEQRYYFNDMGVFTYICESIPTLQKSDVLGIYAENFVYLYLLTKVTNINKGLFKDKKPHTFNLKVPSQEIDFLMHTQTGKRIAIEVKSNNGVTKSAEVALSSGNVDLILKIQKTFGNVFENKVTVPIFSIDKSEKYLN